MGHNVYEYEYTDTFGGEANYCWVKRGSIAACESENGRATTRDAKRKAKAAVGLSGIRGEWSEYGDTLEFRPRGMCSVLFVEWREHVAR